MILEVDARDPTPVYEQIRAQMVRMVAAGTLPPGTRLPTIRQLATDLGVAKGTVAKAYEALLRDDVVRSSGRNGTVINERVVPDEARRDRELLEAARTYAVRVRQLGIDRDAATAAFRAQAAQLE